LPVHGVSFGALFFLLQRAPVLRYFSGAPLPVVSRGCFLDRLRFSQRHRPTELTRGPLLTDPFFSSGFSHTSERRKALTVSLIGFSPVRSPAPPTSRRLTPELILTTFRPYAVLCSSTCHPSLAASLQIPSPPTCVTPCWPLDLLSYDIPLFFPSFPRRWQTIDPRSNPCDSCPRLFAQGFFFFSFFCNTVRSILTVLDGFPTFDIVRGRTF